MKCRIVRTSPVVMSARIAQMGALFDVQSGEKSVVTWNVDLPIEAKPWNVGLIVGPSGCGKSTIARELFGPGLITGYDWPKDQAILDAFPADTSIKDITALLCSVGFSSTPNWVRPFHVLSNGEQFRVTLARALAEQTETSGPVVIDEFTSVVDRNVAKVASHTVQKTVRRSNRQLIAVACHYDIIEWLQPDWVYEPATGAFEWRSLRGRPKLDIEIRSVSRSLWPLFSPHHYMSPYLHPNSKCYGAFINDKPIGFSAIYPFMHAQAHDIMIGARIVVLPDYQGIGLGPYMAEWTGQHCWDHGWRYHSVIAHPGMMGYYARSPRWHLVNLQKIRPSKRYTIKQRPNMHLTARNRTISDGRTQATFMYVAPPGSASRPRTKRSVPV